MPVGVHAVDEAEAPQGLHEVEIADAMDLVVAQQAPARRRPTSRTRSRRACHGLVAPWQASSSLALRITVPRREYVRATSMWDGGLGS
jgi:hypothetical protein